MTEQPWYAVRETGQIATPALVVYRDLVRENLRRIISIAGGTERLRLHVKTHKMAAVVQMQLAAGVQRFKCATIAEAEMLARCDVPDVLVAYHLVGPHPERLARLVEQFPQTRFSTIADDLAALTALARAMDQHDAAVDVLVDLDTGLGRTGVAPGAQAAAVYRLCAELPGVNPGGFHVYDGQHHQPDRAERAAAVETSFAPVLALRRDLEAAGLPVPRIVAGGTPTFPIHARHEDRECSPGTCVFWDAGYGNRFPDLDFLHAAVVMTRVISRPGPGRICLDLGYKAVAADRPDPRVAFPQLPDARTLVHNEEHLVIATERAGELEVGSVLYGIPYHICPTCALHAEAIVIENGKIVDHWQTTARDRRLTI